MAREDARIVTPPQGKLDYVTSDISSLCLFIRNIHRTLNSKNIGVSLIHNRLI